MEKNLYDTSKLIDAYKKNEKIQDTQRYLTLYYRISKSIGTWLNSIISVKIRLQLGFEDFYGTTKNWKKPIPAVDVLLSAIAINNGLRVVTRDKHFLFVKDIMENFEVILE